MASAAPPAAAAVVYLKDGSQVRGTIVSATARDVQLHTDSGTLRIDTEKISRIDYAETAAPTGSVEPPDAELPPTPAGRRGPSEALGEPAQTFWFDFGLASPMSRLGPSSTGGTSARNGATGIRFGGEYLRAMSPQVDAGLSLHYFHRSAIDDYGLVPYGHSVISGDTLMPLAVVKYTLSKRGLARPYLLAGLGANYTSTVVDAEPVDGFSWSDTGTWEPRRLVDDSKWGLASRLALGIDFYHGDPTLVGLEIGWLGVHNDRYAGTPAGRDLGLDSVKGGLNALSVSIKWGLRF